MEIVALELGGYLLHAKGSVHGMTDFMGFNHTMNLIWLSSQPINANIC